MEELKKVIKRYKLKEHQKGVYTGQKNTEKSVIFYCLDCNELNNKEWFLTVQYFNKNNGNNKTTIKSYIAGV